ncbi:MAG: ParB/RepB/Spo0J family partition protein [Saprospiraceae bacterium]|nr:ParB/RepB/Spo0J family partition protein [Saprospiraceae bacterium]
MAKKIRRAGATKADLGSGLDALFTKKMDKDIQENPEKVVKGLANKFAMIPIEHIERNSDQPRKEFDEKALVELSESLKVHGLIQPITVRRLDPKTYQIISGERRWRAAKLAQLKDVPAYIRIANDQTLMEMALIENIQRENLNAFEIAYSYYRLKDEFSLTDQQLATRVGKKRSTITNYLGILDLDLDVIKAIKTDEISLGHAKAIKAVKDKLLQKQVLGKIIEDELSVRAAEELVKQYQTAPTQKKKTSSKRRNNYDYRAVQDDFRAFFGSKGIKLEVEDKEKGVGKIVIPFKTMEELNHFFKCIEQG